VDMFVMRRRIDG